MIKAIIEGPDGRAGLVLGLSFNNLDRLRADPLNDFIKIDGRQFALPVDIMIFAGPDEAAIVEFLRDMIGPDTKVNISDKLKT